MQPHRQFDRILETCKSFSLDFLNSHGNLQHCGRKPLCADVEIIALSLFREFLSIDSECLFFDTLKSILPDLAFRADSRRNYNASLHHLAYLIEKIRARIVKSIPDDESVSIRLIDSMPIEICRYPRAKSCRILKDNEQSAPTFGYCATQQQHYFGYINTLCPFCERYHSSL